MVSQLHTAGESRVLDAVCNRKRSLLELWATYRDDANVGAVKIALTDIDLEPYVEKWHKSLVSRGIKSADNYQVMLRRFMPAGKPFPRSAFTRTRVREFLTQLKVKSGATRNRHRNTLHVFARWLVDEHDGVLELNPVSSVRRAEERARTTYYSEAEAKLLIGAMSGEAKVIAAIMASTGMEWSAVEALRRRDVDFKHHTLHARGGKNYWRDREVVCTLDWCWPIIETHCKTLLPDAPVVSLSHENALDAHHATVKAKKLPKSTLHDWRHTHAILMRRRGMADHLIARQLGHRDTMLIATRYGRFTPDTSEVQAAAGGEAALAASS
jgi:integrase